MVVKKNILKKVVRLGLLLALLSGIYAFYLYNKKVPTLDNVKASYALTADKLYQAYDSNEKDANTKYLNKVIEVTGKVMQVKNEGDSKHIILMAEGAMVGGVNCSIDDDISGIEVGNVVSLKGRCQGFLMNVILNNCIINEDV